MFRGLRGTAFFGHKFEMRVEGGGGDGGQGGGGGGGGSTGGAGDGGKGAAGGGAAKPDPKDTEIADLKAQLAAAKGGAGDKDLLDKARGDQADKDKRATETRATESAIKFDLESEKFLDTNKALLPAEVTEIFKAAKKETYSSAVEKAQALKSGIIQSFFALQANVELLTPGLKSALDDYLKLTKNVKQERAQQVYEQVFEPAFEMLKRIKRAEALGKGFGGSTDEETAYKEKLSKLSRKHYLGEKANA